ncbi:MAG: hypothetical protein WCY11_20215 [Novosphingobium sp.]
MFESEIFGVNVNVGHLVLAVFGLAFITTWALARVTTLKPAMLTIVAVLVTQVLAALLLALLRSRTAQPVHDAQSWIAHALAYFNVIMFWLLCPVFSAPASIFLALWLKRSK